MINGNDRRADTVGSHMERRSSQEEQHVPHTERRSSQGEQHVPHTERRSSQGEQHVPHTKRRSSQEERHAPQAEQWAAQTETIARELAGAGKLKPGQLLVIGVSTSEVLGRRIGTAGAVAAAAALFDGIEAARRDLGFVPAFQCCEHLNRALVLEQDAAERHGLTVVHAVPVPKAGGSMAAHAYTRLASPCLVESIQAHAGIDIGDTFIGMHLRPVAVPVRPSVPAIGAAHVTMAYTRPKLIGGARAVYESNAGLTSGQSAGHCE